MFRDNLPNEFLKKIVNLHIPYNYEVKLLPLFILICCGAPG